MATSDEEAQRILAEYARREREIGRDFYALEKPANLFARQGQARALRDALERAAAFPLAERRILEVGCGRGNWLATLEDLGARRALLAGCDLDAGRLADTRVRFAGADLQVADAARLPWPDASFDLVLQATMFTSILDPEVRVVVAREMRRVLAPGGTIFWYDFRYDNPANRNVRGVRAREIRRLFPGCSVDLARVTLAPPLARRLAPRSWLLALGLEQLGLLNTHYLGTIKPVESSAPRPTR